MVDIETYWEGLHCFDVFSGCFGGLGVGVVELGPPCEVSITVSSSRTRGTGGSLLRSRVVAVPSRATDNLLHQLHIKLPTTDTLHHSQMLEVVVGLK